MNETLTIDLGIDEGLESNQYQWFKNNAPWNLIEGDNDLTFENFQLQDTGIYHVQVTNPNVPDLTLYSRSIRIQEEVPCRVQDSLELVRFFNVTGGPNWTNTWNLNEPMDNWFGVRLNEEGCVTCLDLDGRDGCSSVLGNGNNLTNSLIDLALPNLTALYLSDNEIKRKYS